MHKSMIQTIFALVNAGERLRGRLGSNSCKNMVDSVRSPQILNKGFIKAL
jgi:hypothetical protein